MLDWSEIVLRLGLAALAGGAIGLNRDLHGKPVGVRTLSLVSLATAMVVVLADPIGHGGFTDAGSRVIQGILTGIGFLGAGVIYKENFSVRGLTTAASIWITAAIGILIGIGFYFPAIVSTLLALGILSAFRKIEAMMPAQAYAHYTIGFDRHNTMPEEQLRALLAQHGFSVATMGYCIGSERQLFEYQTVIQTTDPVNHARLAETLRMLEQVREFRIAPTGG